ncbi:unnamed protein product [Ascophyllum nodosum]
MEQDTRGSRPSAASRRTNPLERTLAILIQSMRGNRVVVEMKNDVEISGILEETDGNMNLSMVDVRYTSAQGSVKKMDVALVQGKMIRYVHIPDKVDAISNLHIHMRAMAKSTADYRRNMLKSKTTPK